ncbi:ABC transporter ATP-binding protein [Litorilituus sediminis]|uniref:ABC transporter ATP-binding protein n=1 Tax=Litorilituus sediminis TaxID=718192 RepID=A0A4P6P283_9GAMM|nr:ABC transporter ATP-binding protein [Litorilituus sediminis]QBG35516.1 ABC transporter ATP-binding protein [Litorilituus sediminis]
MTALLTINQLSVNLQDKSILQDLQLTLAQGDILGLVGPSGCGKTTLLNVIAGFIEPSMGFINIDGVDIVSDSTFIAAEKRHVGMIFQDYALFPHLTVRENIAFGIAKLSAEQQAVQIDNLLNLLKLSEHGDKYIHQLSGGQQQRVAIARALAPQPKLLLLDEPFSNIDARLRTELMLEIRQLLKQFNTTAIFVTHNKDEVFTFADKMALMSQGKLLQLDSPAMICQKPNSWQVADFLQLGSWLPCRILDGKAHSALGEVALPKNTEIPQANHHQVLIKPQNLMLVSDAEANAYVEHISVTEQGYHYHLASISDEHDLHFDKLSFYSDQVLAIKQAVAIKVESDNLLLFAKEDIV